MNVFELFGTIAINNSDANRKIDQTGKLANTLGTIFKKVGTVVATVFAVDKIKDFGNACAQTYATIAAENSAFAQIMGDYGDVAKEKMKKVADETGVVASRLTPYMTSMTAKFKGLGYGIDEATTLATEGLTIASDAAAFWDKSLDESMSHLNSFINGSYEGGEAIGLFANDTQMAAYAVEQRIISETKAWAKLDEATKQATRMQYAKEMYKQSGATGQAAKESGEYANVLANLKERWRQLQGVIGQPIMQKIVLPALQKLNKLMPSLTERVKGITEKATAGLETIASYFTDVFTESGIDLSAVPRAFSRLFSDFTQKIPEWLSIAGTKLSNVWKNRVWPSIQDFLKVSFGIEMPSWDAVWSDIQTWWNSDGTAYEKIKDVIKWTLGKFEAPDTSFVTDVQTWWTNTGKPAVTDVAQWTFGELVLPAWLDCFKNVVLWWKNDFQPWLADVTEWFVNPQFPSWESISGEATRWWNSVKGAFESLCTFYVSYNPGRVYAPEELATAGGYEIDTTAGVTVPVKVEEQPHGSHANGLNYVPFDGYRAILHQGESVLTKQEANSWRNGSDIASAVRDAVSGIKFNVMLDSGVLVGQLAPNIDAQLGTIKNRKGRGN